MNDLLLEIKTCKICQHFLEPNPIVSVSENSKILIIGQAPGRIVHQTNIPWNDKSGDNLRNWLGVDATTFYDVSIFGLIPMGLCYPGTGKNGDLPPSQLCAPLWHPKLMKKAQNVELTILVGNYAQQYYLGHQAKATLTQTVQNYLQYLPTYFPLPHPSPRNNIWQAKNEWFTTDVIPNLKRTIKEILERWAK